MKSWGKERQYLSHLKDEEVKTDVIFCVLSTFKVDFSVTEGAVLIIVIEC